MFLYETRWPITIYFPPTRIKDSKVASLEGGRKVNSVIGKKEGQLEKLRYTRSKAALHFPITYTLCIHTSCRMYSTYILITPLTALKVYCLRPGHPP